MSEELVSIKGFTGDQIVFGSQNLLEPGLYYPYTQVNLAEANNPENPQGAIRFREGQQLYEAMSRQITDRAWIVSQGSGKLVVARNVYPFISDSRFRTTFTLTRLNKEVRPIENSIFVIYNDGMTGGWEKARRSFEERLNRLKIAAVSFMPNDPVLLTLSGLTLVTNRLSEEKSRGNLAA